MLKQLGVLLAMSCVILLSSCESPPPSDLKTYLLENPSELQNNVALCQSNQLPAEKCLIVSTAATEFNQLLTEAANDPQAFGARILNAEMQNNESKAAKDNAKILLAIVALTLKQ